MNVWVNLPVAAQLALICALGAMVGGQVNRGIYRLAWVPRPIGPWSEPPPDAPPRAGYDRIPILGWFFLRRESPLHGRGYWIRPCLIEIALAAGFAARARARSSRTSTTTTTTASSWSPPSTARPARSAPARSPGPCSAIAS